MVRVRSLKVALGTPGRWGVIAGCGAFTFSGTKALTQVHTPWLPVGDDRPDDRAAGLPGILVLYENGWHWLDPQNAWDRAVYPWLIDFTPSRPMSPTLRIKGDDFSLGDNQGAEKPSSDVNWLGIGVVSVGMVGTFGGLYWLVNSPKTSTSDGPSGSLDNPDGDSDGTTTPSVVVTSPLSLRENHVGLFMNAQAQGFGSRQVAFGLSGSDKSFFVIDPRTGALSTKPGVVLDYDHPSDQNADNRYDVVIQATDEQGVRAEAALSVSLNNVDDEAPTIMAQSVVFDWREGQVGRIASFVVVDLDTPRNAIEFLLTGVDSDKFSIDPNGVLSAEQALDFESPTDENGDAIFDLILTAKDAAGNTSDAVPIQVRLSNQWEPQVATKVNLADVLQTAQLSMFNAVADEIDHVAVFRGLDFDADGDRDGLFISVDHDGLNGTPSVALAAFDDPYLTSLDQLLWSYGAYVSTLNQLGNISTMSASLVAGTTNDFRSLILGSEGQMEMTIAPLFGGRSVSFEASNDVGPLRLYSDETGDAVYDHFWEITSTGVFRGGENEELPTAVRVSSSLTIGPDLLFAAGDINADQHHDILTFNTVTGAIDAWIMDNDSGDLVKALGTENLYAFSTFPEGFSELANIQQFGFASAPSEVSVGAIPDLFFTAPDALWILSG